MALILFSADMTALELSANFREWTTEMIWRIKNTLTYSPPMSLLRHAWRLLKPGGMMFIMNQGEKEGEAQRRLIEEANIPARYLGVIASGFSPFAKMRVGWLARKP